MHSDLYRSRGKQTGVAVPGNLVPRLIHRRHDRIFAAGSPDEEPEPSLIGERDASASPAAEIRSAGVQDGCARLIGEFADCTGC